jgi:CheY-like chemotaxis protein
METRIPFTLLLAEDDDDIAFFFRRMFRSFEPQWQLEWTRDGVAAINYCMKSGPPDVVVTDLNMPGMNGYEVMAWLRAQPGASCPPIVVYSSTDDETTREKCRAAGASEFISKATQLPRLQELVRRILLSSLDGACREDEPGGSTPIC